MGGREPSQTLGDRVVGSQEGVGAPSSVATPPYRTPAPWEQFSRNSPKNSRFRVRRSNWQPPEARRRAVWAAENLRRPWETVWWARRNRLGRSVRSPRHRIAPRRRCPPVRKFTENDPNPAQDLISDNRPQKSRRQNAKGSCLRIYFPSVLCQGWPVVKFGSPQPIFSLCVRHLN